MSTIMLEILNSAIHIKGEYEKLINHISEYPFYKQVKMLSKSIQILRDKDEECLKDLLDDKVKQAQFFSNYPNLQSKYFGSTKFECKYQDDVNEKEVIDFLKKNYKSPYVSVINKLKDHLDNIKEKKNDSDPIKLKWVGRHSDFPKLIQELISKGYLEMPNNIDKTQIANSLMYLFDFENAKSINSKTTVETNLRKLVSMGSDQQITGSNPFEKIQESKK